MLNKPLRLAASGLLLTLAACAAPAAPAPILPLSTATVPAPPAATLAPPPTALPEATIAAIDAMLEKMDEQGLLNAAVLIGERGVARLSRGYGLANREQHVANTPQTRFQVGSITKQFTAAAVLRLAAQGRLNVQDRVCNFLADCPAAWRAITLHHLLTHTAGLPNYTDQPEHRALRATPAAPEDLMARFRDQPLSRRIFGEP